MSRPEGASPIRASSSRLRCWQEALYTSASDLYAATAVFLEAIGGRASKPGMRTDLRPLLGEGMSKDPSARSATLADFRGELDDYARAVVGETWRKEGRALLIAASADQASQVHPCQFAGRVTQRDGADEALSAVALLRSRGTRSPRTLPMLGAFGLVSLVGVLILVRGFSTPQGFSPIPSSEYSTGYRFSAH